MTPNAQRTAARERAAWQFRYDLCQEVGKCEGCGKRKPTNMLACHEISSGMARQKALDKRFAILVLAICCHAKIQVEQKVRQLARLYLNRPGDYDRVAFNRLRGRADNAITQDEVDAEIEWLLEGGMGE